MGKTTVDAHLYRLKTRGVDLDKYIEKQINNGGILAAWAETPSGFKFACKDIKSFMMELIMNANFAVDTGIGQRFQKGASFREVSKSDSLHILVFKNGYCNELKTRLDYVNVHLDSVSPVRGRDSKTRSIEYEPGEVVQHALTDLLHLPVTLRGSSQGLFLGIRF